MTTEDRLAVQDVMIEYVSRIDERDYDRYFAVFADDVIVDGFVEERLHGVDAIRAFVLPALEPFRATQHLIAPSRITVDGDRAHARTDIQASHWYKAPDKRVMIVWGTYDTDFARTAAGWKIVHHVLVLKATRVSDEGFV